MCSFRHRPRSGRRRDVPAAPIAPLCAARRARGEPPPSSITSRRPAGRRRIEPGEFGGRPMQNVDKVRLTRRDMLKLSIGGAGMFALTASGLAVPRGLAKGGGGIYLEAFPTSPLILSPFNDALPIPQALRPVPKTDVDGWSSPPGPDNQDFVK